MTSDSFGQAADTQNEGVARATTLGVRPPKYRLPSELRLGRVRLQVADPDRSLLFYRDLLGFRVLERTGTDVSLGVPDSDEPLIVLHARPGAQPVPRRGRLGLYHFAVLLPDRAALGRLVAYLANVGAYAGMSDHRVSEALYLTDPDGLGVEIYADRPRSSWSQRDAELLMDTTPLHVADVVAAAEGEPWSGMPRGTRIGHVHLHVGSLERAKEFYHTALGFDLIVWSYPGALFLSAGGYHHHLGTNTWATGAPEATDEDARLLDWEVVLPSASSAQDAVDSLRAAGIDVSESEDGFFIADPWGTVVKVRSLGH